MEPIPTPRSHPAHPRRFLPPAFLILMASFLLAVGAIVQQVGAQGGGTLSAPFERLVLAPSGPEAPFHLRFFPTAVKTDSRGTSHLTARDVDALAAYLRSLQK